MEKVMTRVAFVLHSDGFGGAEQAHLQIAKVLINAGHDVLTLLPNENSRIGKKLKEAGSKTVSVGNLQWWNDPMPFKKIYLDKLECPHITKIMQAFNPELIWSHTGVIPQGAISAMKLGIPHVWHLHEFLTLDHGMRLPSNTFEFGEIVSELSVRVICCSKRVLNHFKLENTDKSQVLYLYPMIEREPLNSEKTHSDLYRLSVVGNLNPRKGHEVVLRAIMQLKPEMRNKLRVSFIGPGLPQDRARLISLIEKLNLSEIVSIIEEISEVSEIYRGVDAIIVPSLHEAFGRVAFEAATYGLPIIYSKSGGLLEYMEDEVSGFGFESGNALELSNKLANLILNYEKYSSVGSKAINHLLNTEKIGLMNHQILEIVRTAKNAKPKAFDLHVVLVKPEYSTILKIFILKCIRKFVFEFRKLRIISEDD
jgi:glycosyltransferase involved in cell wall biosynthesis